MVGALNRLRCLVGLHRWELIRDGAEKGSECRDCKRREFAHDPTPGEAAHILSADKMVAAGRRRADANAKPKRR